MDETGQEIFFAADELLELLSRQQELYSQLRQLALRQRDLIAAEDPSALLNLLARRQTIIDQLSRINRRLEPLRADWARIEAMLTDAQRRRAADMVEQVGQLLSEILAGDEADGKLLAARKAMAGRAIRASAASAQVQAAYRKVSSPAGQGASLDRRIS